MNTAHHQNKPIIIIGSGLAAYTLIREYRKLNTERAITVVTQESGDFYSKPMLSTAFASKKDTQQLISSNAAKMMEQLNIQIHSYSNVSAIDPSNHSLLLQSPDNKEHVLQYSKLVLALGADQIRLDIAGDPTDQILTVNDLKDYADFRERISNTKKVLILGAGLIGCEFANDLSLGGYHVEVVDLADQVLGRYYQKRLLLSSNQGCLI